MHKALFLTLDNTLITTLSTKAYSIHSEDWKFVNQSVEAIKDFKDRGHLILIISNQPAIFAGLVSEKSFNHKMKLITKTLERDLKLKPNTITWEFCTDEDSYCYLPNPGMIYHLAHEYQVDVVNSTLIGNSPYDEFIATSSGIKNYIDVTSLHYDI